MRSLFLIVLSFMFIPFGNSARAFESNQKFEHFRALPEEHRSGWRNRSVAGYSLTLFSTMAVAPAHAGPFEGVERVIDIAIRPVSTAVITSMGAATFRPEVDALIKDLAGEDAHEDGSLPLNEAPPQSEE